MCGQTKFNFVVCPFRAFSSSCVTTSLISFIAHSFIGFFIFHCLFDESVQEDEIFLWRDGDVVKKEE